ncbi:MULTISPECIES: DNA repair protein RadA [Dyadobacter]|uniref:DNA repair protein RadA n=2 Tax=Dyadobacter TaxID=120831 RepID=A0ABY4XF36_9BACT|nr:MULTISPECIES: DNA repair protein RadA [Dyadobacter]MCF2488215.1 DNA repair protein RadA [Dyadobacter sp. CY347]MCF2491979.1 DNA repair protein RadA [Dyadobacter chenhuakuii]MCF2516616.1 DNA repair protein RadA [Dyadobacter sp. CY351]USJ28860.1 DNA repair protein RadA [Dyadobacter chenhuakuii]SKB57563.1 DNA repair protein RadA/Sms [Dyadobacter psychrophilus]
MAKAKTAYFCQECGYNSPKWVGRCPSCGEWNTFVQEVIEKEDKKTAVAWKGVNLASRPRSIAEIEYQNEPRITTFDGELNRVLGGGIVQGSLVLIGGEPGIGKSTLMLQIALTLSNKKVLYVSGEESDQQIKMRAERMDSKSDNCFILTETHTQNIFRQIEDFQPEILIIDSIQTMQSTYIESGAGSVSQVRECTAEFMKYAKEMGVPVFLIGHITKDGSLAGPKVLEHMVDTVLQFEGDRHNTYRILRTVKNRFGSTSELGIYEMHGSGLRQVSNPSEILISQRDEPVSGIAIGSMMEGNRPLLIEIQSLVSVANYGTPQRSSTGFDGKRLQMLLAVLEKRGGFRLGVQDVFLNVAGGLKVEDPAIDLAVIASIVSSYEDKFIPPSVCFAAEVGLGGEVRAVSRIENRIFEAEKLGFKKVYISKYNSRGLDLKKFRIEVIAVASLDELFMSLFLNT